MYNRLGKNQKIIVEKIKVQTINLKHSTNKRLHACIFCNSFEEQLTQLCDSVKGANWVLCDWKCNSYGLIYPVKCRVMNNSIVLKEIQIL